jgi:hypothetical protein
MTTAPARTFSALAREVAAEVDAGTLDRDSALYREFLEAARERTNRRSDDAAEHTTD